MMMTKVMPTTFSYFFRWSCFIRKKNLTGRCYGSKFLNLNNLLFNLSTLHNFHSLDLFLIESLFDGIKQRKVFKAMFFGLLVTKYTSNIIWISTYIAFNWNIDFWKWIIIFQLNTIFFCEDDGSGSINSG